MNQQLMTAERFKSSLETFGADLSKWPDEERADALKYIEASDDAKLILVDMGAFEQYLTQYSTAVPPKGLLEKIIAKVHSK
jgi:hypothetical protein